MRHLSMIVSVVFVIVVVATMVAPQESVDGGELLVTYRRLQPAGETLEFFGRPVDMVLSDDGGTLFIKNRAHLYVVDAETWELVDEIASPGGASLTGIAIHGESVYFTNAGNGLHEFRRGGDGKYALQRSITMPGPGGSGASFPCGVVVRGDTAYVALSRNNTVGVVDLVSGELTSQIEVGIAPYDLVITDEQLFVTNQGGRRATDMDITAPSAGTHTPTRRDGVALTGTVSVIDLVTQNTVKEIEVGLQPGAIEVIIDDHLIAVANANSDTISFIGVGPKEVEFELVVKPDEDLPFGSMPNALVADQATWTLYAACAGNNAVAVIDYSSVPTIKGFIPTGWYPSALALGRDSMFVANMKGIGSRTVRRDEAQGRNSHDHRGTVQKLDYPTRKQLEEYTEKVKVLGLIPQILANYERQGTGDAKPVPVPEKLGAPSVFNHVVYIIKENRTYDQFFGDIERGDGDPNLCVFPERITPNHHALAKEFVLLDNYYCEGVLSADGHSWATEGNVTPYLERAFGGFARSYTFGDDPITYSTSGFIWDHILMGGLSFRNYGEMDYAAPIEGWAVSSIWRNYENARDVKFDQNIGVTRLRRYSSRKYPGWNMAIPDVLRADRFLQEFRSFEAQGWMPNFMIIYLPQDHGAGTTPGYPTMASYMADNDLALGRIVEAISESQFWKDTVIFVNEDDPQAGFDHIDGHRSICLAISPYTKRGAVVSDFYNQNSVLHTALRIFGLPPMNQQNASAPLMTNCFTDTPDFTPYKVRDPQIDMDAVNPPLEELEGDALYWAKRSMEIPMCRPGLKSARDDDDLNRIIWHSMKGYDVPYPSEWAGFHGRGLRNRGLKLDDDKTVDRN